jgi:hypothetical protein
MNPRLKNIIKNKLSEDLSSVSIINYNGSIWFIDSKSKYWYLELYKKTKTLWWRLDFFEDFFILFGMEQREFVPIIIEWVEEVLNGKVVSTDGPGASSARRVEEVLNGEVVSTRRQKLRQETQVEKILNDEGVSADSQIFIQEALCHNLISKMIETTTPDCNSDYFRVEDALNSI